METERKTAKNNKEKKQLIDKLKSALKIALKAIAVILILGLIYLTTLFFPQPFFAHHLTIGNVTVYSDQQIPETEMTKIVNEAVARVQKSAIYKPDTQQNIFIVFSPVLWTYFTNIYNYAGGINYAAFNHNIFLRESDIVNNRMYSPSGQIVPGDRTLDYFIAHEMTHTLEFQSMNWYEYPIQTNWTIEGYAEYIAHGSESYDQALDHYLNTPESVGAKYYTRVRTLVTYLLEKEYLPISQLWSKVNEYDAILKKAIPDDKPNIIETQQNW